MKIAIDASELANRREDGTQIYLYNLLKNIAEIDKKNQYFLYYQNEPKKLIESPNFKHIVKPWPIYWTQSRLPFLLFKEKSDVLFMPIQTLPFLAPARLKTIITIHDLAFLMYPETFLFGDRVKHKVFAWHAVKRADRVIAVSESTKNDIVKFYGTRPEKINIVHHGYDKNLFRPARQRPEPQAMAGEPFQNERDCDTIEQIKRKYRIKKLYLLYVGALQPRKNILGLVKAFELLNNNQYQLVIAGGKAWLYDEMFGYVKKSPLQNNIIFTGRFETGELPPLLWGAEVFVLPSFYEGFGLPVIEAMACGTPVITSNISSLPEVAGKAALLIDPNKPEQITDAIRKILVDKDLKQKMTKDGFENIKKFSWEKCARETLDVFNS